MYVCHCNVVTDRDILESIANGARCVADGARVATASVHSAISCVSIARSEPRAMPNENWEWLVQPVSPRVVELLNDALTFELTVTNTYFLNARMLDAWGLPKLGKVFYDLSIDEMRDADDLIQRVLLFDGHPNLQRLGAIRIGETAEEMLVLALDSEKAAVAQFNASAQECHDLGDHGTAAVFEEMVRDEEKHADWFEAQLGAIERVGLPQYLAAQISTETP
jgi:bacterioferritin